MELQMAKIIEITPAQFKQLSENENVLLCDIREPDEHNRERIHEALNVPLSSFQHGDLQKVANGRTLVFHCQSGNRTKMNANKFANLEAENIYILTGGISEWKKAGFSTIQDEKAPLPIMRQVQMVAGSLIVLGIILAYTVNPAFMLLSGFVGAGLFFAGASGFCGMANLLMFLPYNKKQCQSNCTIKR
jgi:rhodanese-related sulfurtransferase